MAYYTPRPNNEIITASLPDTSSRFPIFADTASYAVTSSYSLNGGSGSVYVSPILYSLAGNASNVNSTETSLFSYTLPSNTIKKNGDSLDISSMFTCGTESKNIRFYYGSTKLYDTGPVITEGVFGFDITLTKFSGSLYIHPKTYWNSMLSLINSPTIYSESVDMSSGGILKFTGQASSSNNIIQLTMRTELKQA